MTTKSLIGAGRVARPVAGVNTAFNMNAPSGKEFR